MLEQINEGGYWTFLGFILTEKNEQFQKLENFIKYCHNKSFIMKRKYQLIWLLG